MISCDETCKANSKFCQRDTKLVAAIEYQATKKGELPTFTQIMNDPAKATEAVIDFDKKNPAGRFRWNLVDWGQWKKTFGVRVEFQVKETQFQMDMTAFIDSKKLNGIKYKL